MYDYRQLARADLNLLVALQVLMAEGSVSRAAERLFVSQSAMSRTLQRLRELFDDPLFIRQSHGLVPTPRAIELCQQLQPLLAAIDQTLAPVTFDPARLQGQFVIACPSLLSANWLPALVARLAIIAPGVKLRSIESIAKPEELLRNAGIDLVVHSADTESGELTAISLPDASALCLVRESHPLVKQKMTLKRFLDYPHLRYFIPGLNTNNLGLVDQRLAKLGKKREVLYDGHDMETLLQITRDSDCIFPLACIKDSHRQWPGIRILQPPTELHIKQLPMALFSLRRRAAEPALRWLIEEISCSFK